jgi:hypothetical protein
MINITSQSKPATERGSSDPPLLGVLILELRSAKEGHSSRNEGAGEGLPGPSGWAEPELSGVSWHLGPKADALLLLWVGL